MLTALRSEKKGKKKDKKVTEFLTATLEDTRVQNMIRAWYYLCNFYHRLKIRLHVIGRQRLPLQAVCALIANNDIIQK